MPGKKRLEVMEKYVVLPLFIPVSRRSCGVCPDIQFYIGKILYVDETCGQQSYKTLNLLIYENKLWGHIKHENALYSSSDAMQLVYFVLWMKSYLIIQYEAENLSLDTKVVVSCCSFLMSQDQSILQVFFILKNLITRFIL